LSAEAWPAGWARLVLPEAASTMEEAGRLAPLLAGPAWILALRQTAGRGRRGRAWVEPPGNFAATAILHPACPPAAAAQRSFVAALALADTLAGLLGGPGRLALKWPNDVLLDGGKVAGILLESTAAGGRVAHLAVGIGVNLVAAPPVAAVEAGALTPVALASAPGGGAVTPAAFLDRLAPAFARWEGRLRDEGFAPLRAAWLARAARIGQRVTARIGETAVTGTFATLDEGGALVLDTPAGRRTIAAAEVHFRPL